MTTPQLTDIEVTVGGLTLTVVEPDPAVEVGEGVELVDIAVAGLPGPRGLPGTGGGSTTVVAGEALVRYRVVRLDESGQAVGASSLDAETATSVLGVAAANVLAGEDVPVVTDGLLDTGGPWVVGPLYLGADGSLTSDPDTGAVQLQVASAVTPTLLIVRPLIPLYHL